MKKTLLTVLSILMLLGMVGCSLEPVDEVTTEVSEEAIVDSGKEYIVEGDMVLNTNNPAHYEVIKQYYPEAEYTGPDQSASSSKALFKANSWPSNTVYYRFTNVTGELRTRVLRAMSTIQLISKVRFVARNQSTYTVAISDSGQPGSGGTATVGYGSNVWISYASNTSIGVCIHEILHVLGFWHEHQRSNRDYYVTVADSVLTNGNYIKITGGNEYGNYDYGSIMHYYDSANLDMGDFASLYQRTHLSPADVVGLCAQYGGFVYDNPIFFNAVYYLNKYPDLKKAFGSDVAKARQHWLKNGINEGRQGSPVFNARYYVNKYADIKKAYGTNYAKCLQHFYVFGIAAGRQGSPEFSAPYYMNRYSDLRSAFNQANYILAANHYITNGIKEGRVGAP